MDRVLLACATPEECRPLLGAEPPRPLRLGGRQAYELGPQALVIICGVGKVNCAQALTAAIEGAREGICALVSFGSAGAYPGSGLGPGDVAVASEAITDELAVLPGGLATLEEMGLPLAGGTTEPLYNRFPVDAGLAERALAAARRATLPGHRAASGPILTVSRVTSSAAEAERLTQLFGPLLAENMEGAAAAQVAYHYGLPFGEVRGVSNLVADRPGQRWEFELAAQACSRTMGALLEDLKVNPL